MCFFCSLVPATVFSVLAFFVHLAACGAAEPVAKAGRMLAAWTLLLALVFPACGAYVTLAGRCPIARIVQRVERLDLPDLR